MLLSIQFVPLVKSNCFICDVWVDLGGVDNLDADGSGELDEDDLEILMNQQTKENQSTSTQQVAFEIEELKLKEEEV